MIRNDYYGGESAPLNLTQLWSKFRGSDKPPPHLGSSRDYNVDMVPKVPTAHCYLSFQMKLILFDILNKFIQIPFNI